MIYMMESVDFQGIFQKMSVVENQTLDLHHLQMLCLLSLAGGVLHRVFGLSRGVMPLRMPVRKLRG